MSIVLLAGSAGAADYPVTMLKLQYKTPAEMIPVIKPLLGSGQSIVGRHDLLILKVPSDRLAEIRRVVESTDRPARQLMISVARVADSRLQSHSRSLGGQLEIGDQGRVSVGKVPPGQDGNTITYRERSGEIIRDQDITQRVRATEGHPAFIQRGAELPVPVEMRQGVGSGRQIVYGSRFVGNGFYVTPSVVGNRVRLQISTQHHDPRAAGITESIDSVVTGYLDEWIAVGGINSTSGNYASGFAGAGSQQSVNQSTILLRVNEVH
ncbi:MAG: hypothetical protein ACWA5Q_07095 [bacterium]